MAAAADAVPRHAHPRLHTPNLQPVWASCKGVRCTHPYTFSTSAKTLIRSTATQEVVVLIAHNVGKHERVA